MYNAFLPLGHHINYPWQAVFLFIIFIQLHTLGMHCPVAQPKEGIENVGKVGLLAEVGGLIPWQRLL